MTSSASSCCPRRWCALDPNPDETLMTFLNSTYEAAAFTANWDHIGLER